MKIVSGNIFKSGADAIVNPVNCEGVMGAGLAKQFAEKYPFNLWAYKAACNGFLNPGKIVVTHFTGSAHVIDKNGIVCNWSFFKRNPSIQQPIIVNFPTKDKWKNKSEYGYIESGLRALEMFPKVFNAKSIAIPALGCGLGELEFEKVAKLIDNFSKKVNMKVELYKP